MKKAGKMGSNSQKLWFNGGQLRFNQENWEKGGLTMKNLDFTYERWQLLYVSENGTPSALLPPAWINVNPGWMITLVDSGGPTPKK